MNINPLRLLRPVLIAALSMAPWSLACSAPIPVGPAIAPATYEAHSNTAVSITGNISLSPDLLVFQNRKSLTIKQVDANMSMGLVLYKVIGKENPKLIRGNVLCDDKKPVDYILARTGPTGKTLELSMIYRTGALTLSALKISTAGNLLGGACATYTYGAVNRRQ